MADAIPISDGRKSYDSTAPADPGWELGPQHLRPEILKEVTFHTDGTGKPLPKPVTLLLASTFNPSPGRVEVSLFARDDATGEWARGTVYSGLIAAH